jgi:hypothetical protein
VQVTIIAGEQAFRAALDAAREVTADVPVRGLAAPLDAGLKGQFDDAWDAIEAALTAAFRGASDTATALLDQALAAADALIAAAGRKAGEIHAQLLARVQTYVAAFVREALGRIEAQISLGLQVFAATSVTCTYKVQLSGSLKASLTEAVELSSGGEIEVAVQYAASH